VEGQSPQNGAHFDTSISDPTTVFDVEVNLDERSRGFRWFFSFYVTFAADTIDGPAANAILLLDEPGLYLHIQSQKDLLTQWEKDFSNQIIYTTHSPLWFPYNISTVSAL
jgi:predicted ATP-dependent endonuclease of OLD family